jgi:Xaa-Pro aminopeptidase
VDQVAHACQAAGAAFTAASAGMRAGLREPDVAGGVTARLEARGLAEPGAVRAGGFAWCMSGPNAALAGAAYARTRNRELRAGDVVLVHCNAQMNGYWTDITRTYSLGEPDKQRREMFEAMLAARAAALAAIRPGAAAADVDAAARAVLTARGYGAAFTHGVGHNVGFSAISAEFPPRLRPDSPDRLEVGMTFNIEPAIYLEGNCGMRHCDVVTLRETGPEVLTPFQARLDELIIGG